MEQAINLWVNKMSKLALKIFVIFILVSLGGLILTSIFINYRFDFYFENYLRNIRRNKVENLKSLLEESYSQYNNWSEAPQIIGNFASLNDYRVILRNEQGEIVAFSTQNMFGRMNRSDMGRMMGQMNNLPPINSQNYDSMKLTHSDNSIGELLWQKSRIEEFFSNTEDIFMNQINRAIYIAALITAILVVSATYFFSKYLTDSLNKMNRVVKEVAEGNLEHKIEIKGNDEVAELGNSFNQMVKKLKHLEKIRKESTSDLAHELRTPLSNMKNYMEAIEDGVIEWNSQTKKEMEEELNRLINLVNRLNELNDAEAKILNVNKEYFNLKDTLQKIIKGFELSAKKKNIVFNIDFKTEEQIYADKSSIQQIISNIISNALKYCYENATIEIEIREEKEDKVIRISNQGPTIDDKDLPYLFERFYKVDKSRSQKVEGMGIGLAITRNLVEANGGSIEVESQNEVTTFIISFPKPIKQW